MVLPVFASSISFMESIVVVPKLHAAPLARQIQQPLVNAAQLQLQLAFHFFSVKRTVHGQFTQRLAGLLKTQRHLFDFRGRGIAIQRRAKTRQVVERARRLGNGKIQAAARPSPASNPG